MNNHAEVNILELKTRIIHHFKEAQYFFSNKHNVNDFNDCAPSNLLIVSEDYRSGIMIIDSLVVEERFVDIESFEIVFGALVRYHNELASDYLMTARRVADLLSEMNDYRAESYTR